MSPPGGRPIAGPEATLTNGLLSSVLQRPGRWLVGLALATAVLAAALPTLQLRTDGAALYPHSNEVVQRTLDDRRAFRETEACLLLLRSAEDGPAVATPEGLRLLRALHKEVAGLEGVRGERVRSLASVIRPIEGELLVFAPDYLDEIPDAAPALAEFLRNLRAEPLTDGLYLAADGRAAALSVPIAKGEDRIEAVARLERWVAGHGLGEYSLELTGPVAVEVLLGRAVLTDLARLVPALMLVITVLLALGLRSVGGVLVTMVEVGVVLLWTFGAMAWTGTPVTLVTAILPVLLLTVAIADEMHLIDRVSAHLRGGLARKAALRAAIKDVGRPIVLTSLTTAVGFLSFLMTGVSPLQHFGLFAAFGVLAAMGLSFTLVPALILLLPERWFSGIEQTRRLRPAWHERLVLGARGREIVLALGVLPLLPGLARLHVADSWVDNLAPEAEAVAAEREFNRQFWGSYRYDIVLEHTDAGFFQEARGLEVLETLREELRDAPHVGGIVSQLVGYEVHARTDNEPLPVSRLPAETIRTFSGDLQKITRRIDLDQFLLGTGRAARMRLYVRNANFESTRELEDFVGARLDALHVEGLSAHVSGELAASQATVSSIVRNMLRSVLWTVLGVGLIIGCFHRSLSRALVVLAPLCVSLLVVLGSMGLAGWPLGIASSMFAAAAIGIGVDFGLHFAHAYERGRQRRPDAEHVEVLKVAFLECGRSLRWNATILCLGMLVLAYSEMKPNRALGVLLAGSIAASYLAMLVLLPSLMRLLRWDPKSVREPPRAP